MIEKEYKFIVNKIPEHCSECFDIRQIYIDKQQTEKYLIQILKIPINETSQIDNVRVRIITNKNKENKYFLTAKTSGLIERNEYEKEISQNTAINIISLKIIGEIHKKRYIFNNFGYKFEFDEYFNYKNLITCEIEVNKENDNYNKIISILKEKYNLKIKDITLKADYKNSNIARRINYENNQ